MAQSPMVRAFLSHSSVDKPFVEQVFNDLGATLAELDQATFEPGKFNRAVIQSALDRCALFVLFASEHSVKSNWVAEEIREAVNRLRDKRMNRILVYCSDKATFQLLDADLKDTNIVRVEKTPSICARQIRGILAEIFADSSRTDAFVSRDENLAELKKVVIDPTKQFHTIAISGFDRLGRRTLAKKFCGDVYGSFTYPTQSIVVDISSSLNDVFRQLLRLQYHNIPQATLVGRLSSFSSLSEQEQATAVGSEIKSIYDQREFVQFIDAGGVLADDGDLSPLIKQIIEQNSGIIDLAHIFILYRNAPDWVKRKYTNIAFYRLPPLTDSQAEIAISHELKKRRASLTPEQINRIVSMIDGHPANLDYIAGYIFLGDKLNPVRLTEVLEHSAEFATWKQGRASAYVNRFSFTETERLLIGLLSRYRALPSEALARFMHDNGIDTPTLGATLARLFDLNVVDINGDEYRLLRPLRDALERDTRFVVNASMSDKFAKVLVETLESYSSEDSVPISLLDSAIIAAIRRDEVPKGWLQQLVLPSHYIWLARESYHKSDWTEAIRYAEGALALTGSMPREARLEALRFAGLSHARQGNENELHGVVREIDRLGFKRARGISHFLKGFHARLSGDLVGAHQELIKASDLIPGGIDVQRELLAVLIARREYGPAMNLANQLVERADTNPYILDGYVQARIALAPSVDALMYDAQFTKRLDQLEVVGDGPGLAFFALRKVDLALKRRSKPEALQYSAQALANTPHLPAAHAARARALIMDGDYEKAWNELKAIEDLSTKKRRSRDGLEQLVLFQVRFEYNLQRNRFELCKADIENMGRLDAAQSKSMKMDLVQKVSTSGMSVEPELRAWLKT